MSEQSWETGSFWLHVYHLKLFRQLRSRCWSWRSSCSHFARSHSSRAAQISFFARTWLCIYRNDAPKLELWCCQFQLWTRFQGTPLDSHTHDAVMSVSQLAEIALPTLLITAVAVSEQATGLALMFWLAWWISKALIPQLSPWRKRFWCCPTLLVHFHPA